MQINAAIQLLPFGNDEEKYKIIDSAIQLIQKSGLVHLVCPFETVVEGEAQKVYSLIESIRTESLKHCSDVIINVKIHGANRDLRIDEKLEKYS
ncbi:MAG: thiamine-binding protein [Bacteroidota bacterium]